MIALQPPPSSVPMIRSIGLLFSDLFLIFFSLQEFLGVTQQVLLYTRKCKDALSRSQWLKEEWLFLEDPQAFSVKWLLTSFFSRRNIDFFFLPLCFRFCILPWAVCWNLCPGSKHREAGRPSSWCYHQIWADHALFLSRNQYWALFVKLVSAVWF